MNSVQEVSMSVLNGFDPAPLQQLPKRITPSFMCMLLGGVFPDNGFTWNSVSYFQLEDDGVWEPYNAFDEILPTNGFMIEVKENFN